MSIALSELESAFTLADKPTSVSRCRVLDPIDQALLRGLNDGDEAGFAAFYKRFAGVLFSMIWRIVGDQADAEDTLQDAFIQMWKKSATFDPARGSLLTWAIMIARSKAIDRLRQRNTRYRYQEAAIAEDLVNSETGRGTGPVDQTMRAEEQRRIAAALATLPLPQQEALQLAFFSAMTHREISASLKIPQGTAKARIRRGLITLRETLLRRDETSLRLG